MNVRAHDEGRGPVVLVLHGGMDDGSSWSRVAALLTPRFRVVRPHRLQYRLDLKTGRGRTMAERRSSISGRSSSRSASRWWCSGTRPEPC